MNRRARPVLETARAREVAGIFHSRARLREAVDALLLSGFDRADLDLVGGVARLRRALGEGKIPIDELLSKRNPSRKVPVGRENIALVQAMVVAIFGFLAAAGAAAIVIATQHDVMQGLIAAIFAATVACAVCGYIFARRVKLRDVAVVDEVGANREIMLWVRVDSSDREARAKEILLEHDAESVRTLEVEIAKTPDDLPLSRFRPDPFIPVRLGDL